MKQPPWDWDPSAEWEELIGRSFLRFADIEYISVMCLSLIPTDKISDAASQLSFARRASLLIEILEARDNRDRHTEGLLDGLRRAKALTKTRNLIAHNPMVLNLYFNEDRTAHDVEHTIASRRGKGRKIDLAELKEFAADVENVSTLLWQSYIELDPESGEVI